jgi:hypothetical protein
MATNTADSNDNNRSPRAVSNLVKWFWSPEKGHWHFRFGDGSTPEEPNTGVDPETVLWNLLEEETRNDGRPPVGLFDIALVEAQRKQRESKRMCGFYFGDDLNRVLTSASSLATGFVLEPQQEGDELLGHIPRRRAMTAMLCSSTTELTRLLNPSCQGDHQFGSVEAARVRFGPLKGIGRIVRTLSRLFTIGSI